MVIVSCLEVMGIFSACIVNLKIDENRNKQKISTDPYFGCYSYAVFTTKF